MVRSGYKSIGIIRTFFSLELLHEEIILLQIGNPVIFESKFSFHSRNFALSLRWQKFLLATFIAKQPFSLQFLELLIYCIWSWPGVQFSLSSHAVVLNTSADSSSNIRFTHLFVTERASVWDASPSSSRVSYDPFGANNFHWPCPLSRDARRISICGKRSAHTGRPAYGWRHIHYPATRISQYSQALACV